MAADRRSAPRGPASLPAAVVAALVTGVAASAAVGAVGGSAGAQLPEPHHDPDEVRGLAEEILSRPEFQPPPETWLQRFARWLSELFGDDRPATEVPTGGAGGGGSGLLTVVLLVVALAVIVVAVRALLGRPRRRRSVDEEPDVEIEERRDAGQWSTAAERHEAAGRWKEGLRCRFRSLVERLVQDGALPAIPGRTTGELRGDLAGSAPAAAGDFDAAADLFDRAWYGDLPTGPDEARRFAAHAEEVRRRIDEQRPADDELVEAGAG